MGRLDGKRIIVTGAASGIGKGTVARMLDEGAKVAAVDLNKDGLTDWQAAATAGKDVQTFVLDVSNRAEVEEQLGAAIGWLGGCDILVNGAGITTSGDPLELPEEDFDRVMDVNVKGSFLCAQVAGRQMKAQGGGSIVNISSVSAELANPHHVHYSTSKGAVRMLTKALAVALAPYNIRVNAVGPGPVLTGMGQSEIYRDEEHTQRLLGRVLRGRVGTPEDIAAAVVFLASDEADFINGTTLYADGGVLAVR
ncbi:SDR family NAD(P)-dependent oxidoreductase [Streptomyces sp. NPDC057580]|uniref:SDR family NAD(P)-dependent oxidoreductase n=1 Tax=Streptomyces sp. NPDC057580 TaxID=3346173 RepID=UPI0036CA718F